MINPHLGQHFSHRSEKVLYVPWEPSKKKVSDWERTGYRVLERENWPPLLTKVLAMKPVKAF
jgi:hypothetical protein